MQNNMPIKAVAKKAQLHVAQIAQRLGMSRQRVNLWDAVPAEHVLKVEDATGVSRHDIRPDLYPRDGKYDA